VTVPEAAVAEGLATVELADIFNRWKTRCGSRSIAGYKHPDDAMQVLVRRTLLRVILLHRLKSLRHLCTLASKRGP
jgi:hypothetical protein